MVRGVTMPKSVLKQRGRPAFPLDRIKSNGFTPAQDPRVCLPGLTGFWDIK